MVTPSAGTTGVVSSSKTPEDETPEDEDASESFEAALQRHKETAAAIQHAKGLGVHAVEMEAAALMAFAAAR